MPVWPLVPGGQVPKAGTPGYVLLVDQGGHKGGSGRKNSIIVKIIEMLYPTCSSIKIVDC